MKDFDYSSVKKHKTYNILMPLSRLVVRIAYKVKIVGTENIPAKGGFILASNHITAFDPVIIASVKGRPVHYMSKKELFEKPLIGWFLSKLNAFPINRGGSDKRAITYAIKIVQEGGILGIFPEGTRSETGKPISPKAGVALIAKAAKADILPVSIYSSSNSKLFSKLTVRFGELIPFDELGISENGRSSELRNASRLIMNSIIELWEEEHCE